jgi:DNA-directed RNA polymerase subunit H (RpoH/RPB5)
MDTVLETVRQMLKVRNYKLVNPRDESVDEGSVTDELSPPQGTTPAGKHPFETIVRGVKKRSASCTDVDNHPTGSVHREKARARVPIKGASVCEVRSATSSNEKIGVREIRAVIEESAARNISNLILITPNRITSFAQRECEAKNVDPLYPFIELWIHEELLFNVLRHFTQPTFTTVEKRDRDDLLLKCGGVSKLPKMLAADPVARFMGLRKGTMLRVDRSLPGGQTMVCYRVVS